MYRLLKTEINYFKLHLSVIVLVSLIFTICALNNIKLFPQIYFLEKYFWSVIVGLGIYALVFMIWSMRKKEMRERQHALLPISINKLTFTRWLFGVSPFILVGFYIEMLRSILPSQQLIYIERINGQLGMMFIALVGFDLVINSWFALQSKRYDKRLIYTVILSIALIILSFGVIYIVSASIIKPFGFGGEEIFFFIWALIISLVDATIFTKRKLLVG